MFRILVTDVASPPPTLENLVQENKYAAVVPALSQV